MLLCLLVATSVRAYSHPIREREPPTSQSDIERRIFYNDSILQQFEAEGRYVITDGEASFAVNGVQYYWDRGWQPSKIPLLYTQCSAVLDSGFSYTLEYSDGKAPSTLHWNCGHSGCKDWGCTRPLQEDRGQIIMWGTASSVILVVLISCALSLRKKIKAAAERKRAIEREKELVLLGEGSSVLASDRPYFTWSDPAAY